MDNKYQSQSDQAQPAAQENWLPLVRKALASLQFGIVQIVVHNSRVVQVETTEKVRLTPEN